MKKLRFDRGVPWPLITSTFINKSGEMALGLLPMLLIERNFSSADASATLGFSKAAQVAGLFLGGYLADYLGFRVLILASFLSGAIGFTALPFLKSTLLIMSFAVFAQLGSSLFSASARSMLRESGGQTLKKNFAWLKMSSNLGQVLSSSIGICFGYLGLVFPFILDGATSFIAFGIGFFTLKNPKTQPHHETEASVHEGYFMYSFMLTFFYFIYELGYLGFSGFAKIAFGENSIQAFSIVLLVNTFLCGSLAIPAAHVFKNAKAALSTGVLVTAAGMIALVLLPKTVLYFALCSLIMTIGEIAFSVYSRALLMANSSGKSSRHYGLSLMIQTLGRFGAGVCLFPLVLRSSHPELPFIVGLACFFALFFGIPKTFFERAN